MRPAGEDVAALWREGTARAGERERERRLRRSPPPWWLCACGRAVYEHAYRTVPSTGGREIVCGRVESGRFECADGVHDYSPEGGLVVKRR